MKKEEISMQVNNWIIEEKMPNGRLKPIKKFEDLYPENHDWESYTDFRAWYFAKDHAVLFSIPNKEEFKLPVETDEACSFVYQSMDFQRLYPFDKYQYKLGKISARIFDLATTFSSISQIDGKRRTLEKFQRLVNEHFRDKLLKKVKEYKENESKWKQKSLLREINHLNTKIGWCKRLWNKYAFIQ